METVNCLYVVLHIICWYFPSFIPTHGILNLQAPDFNTFHIDDLSHFLAHLFKDPIHSLSVIRVMSDVVIRHVPVDMTMFDQ